VDEAISSGKILGNGWRHQYSCTPDQSKILKGSSMGGDNNGGGGNKRKEGREGVMVEEGRQFPLVVRI